MLYPVSYTHLDVYKRQDEYKTDELTDYLDEIKTSLSYKNWIFGHYHDNKMITDKDILIYEQIIRIK